ncbi:MAG TPA: hypothetical protein VNT60_08710 [Deinococcales bacterium]|nr:hypothetical protein [Deinococcales bacterium]
MLAPAELLILVILGTSWLAAVVTAIRSPRVTAAARLPWLLVIVLGNVIGALVFFGWLLLAIPASSSES